MKLLLTSGLLLAATLSATSQDLMTPELLWKLKRVSATGISPDKKELYYSTRTIDVATEKGIIVNYVMNIASGEIRRLGTERDIIQRDAGGVYFREGAKLYRSSRDADQEELIFDGLEEAGDVRISPDGKYIAFSREVMVQPMEGKDLYGDLPKTTAKVYRNLNYRHWDTWEDGKYSHIFIARATPGAVAEDIMAGEPYDAPQKPFGGAEDIVWRPDSRGLIYVCKKKSGKDYAQSTNTDLYHYNLATRNTENWTQGMMGYDNSPQFSPDGKRIAWVSMKRDGFEADKTDIVVMNIDMKGVYRMNLTEGWDGHASSFIWSNDGSRIYFNAPYRGTEQLFYIPVPARLERSYSYQLKTTNPVKKITQGVFDIAGIVGQSGNELIVSRTDMNHAAELYAVNMASGRMEQLTHENDAAYSRIKTSETKLRMIKTSDGKEMGAWVIYPPDFDPKKKYPTLLYCQGGPQSALTQFYSFRWNFQLMAAQGYIVIAPNRRGMPGWGTKWNEDISKDWGGQPMRDYLSAIDDLSKEPYVDKDRLGCVGASYGGYSVFMLAGMHNNRFKTFIAHDGLFDLKSWYGTTEELWFANWDIGGNYWSSPAPKSYEQFNPSNFIAKWNTPIMIVQGGQDFRVGIEQGLEAFQAAQLKGIKSKLLYLPNENHWVLHPQNAIVWQREFFGWLDETLQ